MREYGTAERRWEAIGPYYAMFPTSFADEVVARYTDPGDIVLDPFAGRGTTVFSAAHQGRYGIGIEINPVGWVYAKTKLWPASKKAVESRIMQLGNFAAAYSSQADALPIFFHHCYSQRIREFLLAARNSLAWRENRTDRTVMALLLVYLHGKRGTALSNQMRQTKAMSPDYAVRWWRDHELDPPDLDPVTFMISRLQWRYAKGSPSIQDSDVYLGDSERQLPALDQTLKRRGKLVSLLFTSPPYFALTNYHYDQWLRLWLLGGLPTARRVPGSSDVRGKFESAVKYRGLLQNVFTGAAQIMDSRSIIYVRTGLGNVTFNTTLDILRQTFPGHRLHKEPQPYTRPTQTSLFGDFERKVGEVDIVMLSY